MNKYKIVSIYKDFVGTTCEHCGRGIKNVATLEDIVTGDWIKVGLTCLNQLMELKETFIERVQKEANKYYTLEDKVKKYRELDKQNSINIEMVEDTYYIRSIITLIEHIEMMNKLGTKGYIQLNNIECLKKECNEACIKYGYNTEYNL